MLLHEDLPYGDHPRQRYDLYVPSSYEAAVVYLHGGGWEDGGKSWETVRELGIFLAQRGLLVAIPNYRLVGGVSQIPEELRGDGRYPNNVQDIQLFLKQFCPEVPVCLVGESAGGHLAILSLLGLDCLPAGVLSISAPMDLCASSVTEEGQRLIDAYTSGDKEIAIQASPYHRIAEYEQLLGGVNIKLYFWRNAQDSLTVSGMSLGFIGWAKAFLGESRVKEVVVDMWSKDNPHKVSLDVGQKGNLVLNGVNFILQRDGHDISKQ